MAVAVFDYDLWAARYPELAPSVSRAMAAALFDEAGAYLDNTDVSIVADPVKRLRLLNMLVSHLAVLNVAVNGQAPSGLVGRITNASEGSVSVATDIGTMTNASAWFMQTRYGMSFWQATASLRTMRYIPGRQPVFDRPWGAYWRR